MHQDNAYAAGDLLEVHTKDKLYQGTYVPQEGDALVLKLPSGYNMGILKNSITQIKLLKKHEPKKHVVAPAQQNMQLPLVSILHTGGTIASKVDYATGGVIARFSPEELLSMFPELSAKVRLRSQLLANMWSDDMRLDHYNSMAQAVKAEIDAGATGIVITHGTDTLHYSAAALSFMLENLHIPVILVGAQRSSDRGSSDAGMNLLCAIEVITKTDFGGVGICMHAGTDDTLCHLLPPTKSRKMHSSRRDAFKPVNAIAFMSIDNEQKNIKILDAHFPKKNLAHAKQCTVLPFKPSLKIGLLKVHPHMYASEVIAFKGFDGLIIEGTGLGHAPISVIDTGTAEHEKIAKAIGDLCKDTVVAMTSQTIYGRIAMDVYSPGRKLQELGVLGNLLDMTADTAFIKLAWLLSNFDKPTVRKKYAENLRGEISTQSPAPGFELP